MMLITFYAYYGEMGAAGYTVGWVAGCGVGWGVGVTVVVEAVMIGWMVVG